MSHMIRDALAKDAKLTITPAIAKAIINYVHSYETYGTNMNAFTSPYLGIYTCVFRSIDRDGLFEIFNMDTGTITKFINSKNDGKSTVFGVKMTSIAAMLSNYLNTFKKNLLTLGISSSDMSKIIRDIPTIDNNFKVTSDPFNIMCIWVVYNLLTTKLDKKLQYDAAASVLRILQYKFFTSLVNFRFKYRPNEAAMQTTYESLSDKYDIKKYGTWKNLMDNRVNEFLADDSIHYKTLRNLDDDGRYLYIISDLQSRIRAQINLYVEEYMRVKDTNDLIGNYQTVGTGTDGDKMLINNEQGIDMAIASVYQDCMSVSRLLDDHAIKLVTGLFSAIRPDQLRQLLIGFSEQAVKLAKANHSELTKTTADGVVHLKGAHILIQYIIQQTYRYCRNTGVNMNIPTEIIKGAKNVYSSSRIIDPGIVAVRESVNDLVLELQSSTRETTISALKISFILYILLLSLKYIK